MLFVCHNLKDYQYLKKILKIEKDFKNKILSKIFTYAGKSLLQHHHLLNPKYNEVLESEETCAELFLKQPFSISCYAWKTMHKHFQNLQLRNMHKNLICVNAC